MPEPSGPPDAVLLMGYGSPERAEELPEYLTDVLRGRPPSEAMVHEYARRYALIGGSPQSRVLRSIRDKLERRLVARGRAAPVYLGTKHGHPHLAEVVPRAAADGARRIVAVPVSPFASTWILEPYRAALARGREAAAAPVEIELRAGWHLDPNLIRYWSRAIVGELQELQDPLATVLLTAHSLPQRYRDLGDPYPEILAATASAIATATPLPRWEFAYQSAGNTTEPWLGPDVTERMLAVQARGGKQQLLASFGFVFDHLETLYDLDVVLRAFAEDHGIPYHRVPMPNDADEVVEALASAVLRDGPSERIGGTNGPGAAP